MNIVGAGLAGLMAAHAFPNARLWEAAPEPTAAHHALLRFRSDAVSRLTGVEFTPVAVHKGIFWRGQYRAPDIRLANLYSRKVLAGALLDRSIWDLAPVTRWVAPMDLYERLLDAVRNRVSWATPWDFTTPGPVLSTAPLPVVLGCFGMEPRHTFKHESIRVLRYRLPDAHVHQTVYFPELAHTMYRASITGNVLIVEFAGSEDDGQGWEAELANAFALPECIEIMDEVDQKYGQIAPIDETARKRIIATLTTDHGIYSVGRFATWRNILLDDVVQDLAIVKRLLVASDYDRAMAAL